MTAKHLFGTMCAIMGLLFATGETLTNGILAVVFMGVAAYLLRDYATEHAEKTETPSNSPIMGRNDPSDSPIMGRTMNANKSIRMANRAA